MNKNSYDRWFLLAFKYLLEKNWKRRQKKLASDVGVAEGFISDIKNDKNFPSRDTQVVIAEKMGYPDFDDFISLGRDIETNMVSTVQKNPETVSTHKPNNIHLFPINKTHENTFL